MSIRLPIMLTPPQFVEFFLKFKEVFESYRTVAVKSAPTVLECSESDLQRGQAAVANCLLVSECGRIPELTNHIRKGVNGFIVRQDVSLGENIFVLHVL